MTSATQERTDSGVYVFAPIIERFTYAKPFRGDEAKGIYDEVKQRVAKDFPDVSDFNNYFMFNEETGEINGSNTKYCILVNKELIKSGLWLPTVKEGRQLDADGKLSNGVYREYGIVVYDGSNPNSEIAKVFVQEAKKRNLELPLVLPFSALNLKRKTGAIIPYKEMQGFKCGEEARNILDQFNYKANSSVRRLSRGGGGDWCAFGGGLAGSGTDGQVDFVCGEATRENLEGIILEEVEDIGREGLAKVNERISLAKQSARSILRGGEII